VDHRCTAGVPPITARIARMPAGGVGAATVRYDIRKPPPVSYGQDDVHAEPRRTDGDTKALHERRHL